MKINRQFVLKPNQLKSIYILSVKPTGKGGTGIVIVKGFMENVFKMLENQ